MTEYSINTATIKQTGKYDDLMENALKKNITYSYTSPHLNKNRKRTATRLEVNNKGFEKEK